MAVPKIQTGLIAPGEVELVALNVGEEIAAVRSGLATGRARPVPILPRVCFLMLAPLSSLVSEETEKSQLEWLQHEEPPSQPRPNQHIYQIKTPVWVMNVCQLHAGK